MAFDNDNNKQLDPSQVAYIKLAMPWAFEAREDELDAALARKLAAAEQPARGKHAKGHCVGGFRVLKCDVFAILLTIIIFSAGLYSWEDKRQLPSVVAASAFSLALAVSTYLEGARR